jgi:hypothetical protein
VAGGSQLLKPHRRLLLEEVLHGGLRRDVGEEVEVELCRDEVRLPGVYVLAIEGGTSFLSFSDL